MGYNNSGGADAEAEAEANETNNLKHQHKHKPRRWLPFCLSKLLHSSSVSKVARGRKEEWGWSGLGWGGALVKVGKDKVVGAVEVGC
jgi:hypothetical protein